jgi:hypothetical protein
VTSITSPTSGATVTGTVSVAATASDNVGVVRVDLQVDGVVTGSASSAPYTFAWASGPGSHTLQTVAWDAAGNRGTSAPVAISGGAATDTTAPTIAMTNPVNGSVVARNTTISIGASAADNVGLTRVDFYVNNALLGSDMSGPYTWNWKVPAKTGVTYVIKAVAYDAAGNAAAATSTVSSK